MFQILWLTYLLRLSVLVAKAMMETEQVVSLRFSGKMPIPERVVILGGWFLKSIRCGTPSPRNIKPHNLQQVQGGSLATV